MVEKYIEKPVPIEAIQWTGKNFDELKKFAGDSNVWLDDNDYLHVKTLEGPFCSFNKTGDYLVKSINGTFYIYDKQIFEEIYQKI